VNHTNAPCRSRIIASPAPMASDESASDLRQARAAQGERRSCKLEQQRTASTRHLAVHNGRKLGRLVSVRGLHDTQGSARNDTPHIHAQTDLWGAKTPWKTTRGHASRPHALSSNQLFLRTPLCPRLGVQAAVLWSDVGRGPIPFSGFRPIKVLAQHRVQTRH
jgi:hypothetical protein